MRLNEMFLLLNDEKGEVKMDLLKKIENAIEFLEEERVSEIEVPLTYAELKGIRKQLLMDELSFKLSKENLKDGREFGKLLNQ